MSRGNRYPLSNISGFFMPGSERGAGLFLFVNIMPYSLQNPPDKIKGLPAHAKKVWIEAFNNALKLYKGDEKKANMTAWSAVEKAGYGQDKDGKWHKVKEDVTRNSFKLSDVIQLGQKLKLKDILEELKEDKVDYGQLLQWRQVAISLKEAGARHSKKDNELLNQIIAICQQLLKSRSEFTAFNKSKKQEAKMKEKDTDKNLQEIDINIRHATLAEANASFDKTKGNVELTVVEGGWSHNDNYWTEKALNTLPPAFARRKKVYIDHQTEAKKPRSIRDWAAQITEIQKDENRVRSEIHLFDKPSFCQALRERMEEYPQEVGVSVDVRAKVRQGEIDGRKGQIVEEVVSARSFDFVAEASAGGKVDKLLESELFKCPGQCEQAGKELPIHDILELVEGELAKLLKAKDERNKLWELWSSLRTLLRVISGAIGQDETAKKKRIADALDEFKGMILKFDPATFMTEQITPDKSSEEVKTEMELKDLNVLNLTQARPDLMTEIKEIVIREFKEEEEIDKTKKELERLQEENKTMAKDLDDFKVKEAEQKKQEEIDKELEESKLDKRHITDQFIKDLMAAETKEERDAKIKDRMELVSTVKDPGKVKNHGERKTEGKKEKDQLTINDEQAAKTLTG